MGLNKFEHCSLEHKNELQYCCLRTNKVYCQRCWDKELHMFKCNSSRCGHFQKIAHLVIDKTLEMKVMHLTADMSSSKEKYQMYYRHFYQLKEVITQFVKSDIENKLPLFLWESIIEILNQKSNSIGDIIYEEGTCSDMLRLIKRKDVKKVQNLEEAINGYEKITHLFGGLKTRNGNRQYTGSKDADIEKIFNFYNQEAEKFISSLQINIKKQVEAGLKTMLRKFDPPIQFEGVRFNSKGNFGSTEGYTFKNLCAQLLPEMAPTEAKNYNGIDLRIQQLERNTENMLEAGKSFLKQKIYKIYHNIKTMKSSFPYKYGYVISTCLTPDPDYELCLLDIEKMNIKTFEKKSENPFLSSVNLIIMGPELITFEFKNNPSNSVNINVFGFQKHREQHYLAIIDRIIGEKGHNKIQIRKNITNFTFENQVSKQSLIYIEFQIAYEHLFMVKQQRGQFEGEKYAEARGNSLFNQIINKWNEQAIMDFEIKVDIDKIITLSI